MEFESSQDTAIRLNVTVRTVQKWAKEGKIPGAKQVGRTWMIPVGIQGPIALLPEVLEHQHIEQIEMKKVMPLLNSSFEPGHCWDYIKTITDPDERAIAMGEYYYHTGQSEKAVVIVEKYLEHPEVSIKLSACLIYIFATLGIGGEGKRAHLAHSGIEYARKYVTEILQSDCSPEMRATGVFIIRSIAVLLHVHNRIVPPLEGELAYLPNGLKLFGAYVLAHEAYLRKEYERSLGIAKTALLFYRETYPIVEIYLNLIVATDLAILKNTKEAREFFMEAWKLAQRDHLIQIFAEHHGILHGMVEACMKKQWPEEFKEITKNAQSFNAGWVKVHKNETGHLVTDSLTTTEFSIAMLYNKGWSVKEISAHIEMSERTIKHHISVIYEKLGISSRNELVDFMKH